MNLRYGPRAVAWAGSYEPTNPAHSRISSPVGARFVSPALQRGESDPIQSCSPEGARFVSPALQRGGSDPIQSCSPVGARFVSPALQRGEVVPNNHAAP